MKTYLANLGLELAKSLCDVNSVPHARITLSNSTPKGFCGRYYHGSNNITVHVPNCANRHPIYSWPSYITDRTPYGVIQHEMGHYFDDMISSRIGYSLSRSIWNSCYSKRLTSYAPNNSEWFAEMFRVFVTNPGLLKLVRPAVYHEITSRGIISPTQLDHKVELSRFEAPDRIYSRLNSFEIC